jgi:hypothetical protein
MILSTSSTVIVFTVAKERITRASFHNMCSAAALLAVQTYKRSL